MSINLLRAFIEGEVSRAVPTLPVQFMNAPFTQPPNTAFGKLDIMPAKPIRSSIGKTRFKIQVGVVQMTIAVPDDTGAGFAITTAEDSLSPMSETEVRLSDTVTCRFQVSGLEKTSDSNGQFTAIACVAFELRTLETTLK